MTTQTKQIDKISNRIKVRFVDDGFRPYFNPSDESRQVYKVYLSFNGKKTMFTYGDSIANSTEGKSPCYNVITNQEYKNDILDCITRDYYSECENFDDFCTEFGYDSDSRKSYKVYKAVKRQSEKLHKVFTNADIDQLRSELEEPEN